MLQVQQNEPVELSSPIRLKSENENLWSTVELKPKIVLKEHLNSVDCVQFNKKNPSQVVSGSHDQTIRIWDINQKKSVSVLKKHTEGIWTCIYNNDYTQLVSGSPDTTCIIWDLKSCKPIQEIKENKGKVYCAKFNEKNNLVASCGDDSNIILYDVVGQKLFKIIKTDSKRFYSLEFSRDGKFLAATDYHGRLSLFETGGFNLVDITPKEDWHIVEEEDVVTNRAFTVDLDFRQNSLFKNLIYVGYQNSYTKVWELNPQTNKLILQSRIHGHLDSIKNICLQGEKGIYSTCARDGTVRVWDGKQQNRFIASLIDHTQTTAYTDIYADKSQTLVATASWDQLVHIYKI